MTRPWSSLSSCAHGLLVGAVTALGMPGTGLTLLMPAGLTAAAFLAIRCSTAVRAAVLGLGFGVGFFSLSTIGALAWGTRVPIAMTAIGTSLYALPLVLWVYWAASRLPSGALFAASASFWALCMDLGDLVGFPTKAEALGAVSSIPWLLGGARLVGINVTCGLMMAGVVCMAQRLAEARQRRNYDMALLFPAGWSMAALLGLTLLARATAPNETRSLTVGVPQLNVDNVYYESRQILPDITTALDDALSQQLAELGDVSLLALTETYDGRFSLLVPQLRERWQEYARLNDQAVLLTSYLVAPGGGGFNAVGGISASGQLVGIHRKVDLAPFGEPYLTRGRKHRAMELLPGVRVGVLVCQESVLPRGPRALAEDGADLLVTTTSDSSFGSSILALGHLAAAQLRAIETGRSMIWASNAGPSGGITRWGVFEPKGPFREPRAVRMSAELHSDLTPFLRAPWLWPFLSAALLAGVWARSSTRREPLGCELEPSALGSITILLTAVLFVGGLLLVSPALVEIRAGRRDRAASAIRDMFRRHPIVLTANPYRRFVTAPPDSAAGALAFYLDYYGLTRSASGIALGAHDPAWTTLEAFLAGERFPALRIQLDPNHLPNTATLVRFKSGEYGVLTSGLGIVSVFSPVRGGPQSMTPGEVPGVLEAVGLVPNDEPE